jgi:hypothetical protein
LLAEYGLDTPQKAFSGLNEYGLLPPRMTFANFEALYTELQSEAAELQPVPLLRPLPPEELMGAGFLTGMGNNGNGHHPNGTK